MSRSNGENISERGTAAATLSKLDPVAKHVPALVDILKDKSQSNRFSAVSCLGKIGPAGVPGLIEALKDKDEIVRGLSAIALGKMGPAAKEALPALRALSGSDRHGDVAKAVNKIESPKTK